MKQFITGNDAYGRVNLRENEFESMLPRYWNRLAKDWLLSNWKPLLDSPHGRVRPDAIAVNPDLRRWIVVEVELAQHPESHFRSQFEALECAYYGRHLTPSFEGVETGLSTEALVEMLVREPPSFLCIVDEANDRIHQACRDFGFELAVLTPHRSSLGDYAFLVSRMPKYLVEAETNPRFVLRLGTSSMGGRMTAELPASFPRRTAISVRYQDIVNDVRVIDAVGRRRIFLPPDYSPVGGSPPALHPIDPAEGLYQLS